MIILDNITVSYKNNTVLSDINLYCMQGQITMLHGCNGSGKSTLLNTIIGNNKIDSGKIIYKDLEYKGEMRKYGYMSQNNLLFEHLTCYENIILSISDKNTPDMYFQVTKMIKDFNLEKIIEKYPHEISLGQKQLICFIRAIGVDSDYIILDEPTSALESKNIKIMKNILYTQKEKNKTILIISHDYIFSQDIGDKKYEIVEGKIIKK